MRRSIPVFAAAASRSLTVHNSNEKRELTFKEEGQEYAQVLKMLGNGRLEAMVRSLSVMLQAWKGKQRLTIPAVL